uniref:NADH-ubiquinone oxidoreductase chain 4L n=1 Tax=Patella vulgata TaxID=6465 RepID=A0A481MVK8_PATVU|nr:NADH dehydrogenase subunit 4L [Patella vulgata]
MLQDNNMMITGLLMLLVTMVCLIIQNSRALMVLFLFEILTLSIYLMLSTKFIMQGSPLPAMIFLVLSVCEASVGLALLVSIIRNYGSDQVFSK